MLSNQFGSPFGYHESQNPSLSANFLGEPMALLVGLCITLNQRIPQPSMILISPNKIYFQTTQM
jgi:hypothetical protein